MSTRTAWIVYIVLRLLFFAVPFAALYMIGWHWALAAIVAALVSISLSVLFLSKPRETAAVSIHEWRHRDRTHDDIVEDAEIAAGEAAAPGTSTDTAANPAAASTAASDASADDSESERSA